VPAALRIGVSPAYGVAFAAACYACCIRSAFERLRRNPVRPFGPTRIGQYVINHGFIVPRLIDASSSCVVGYFIAAARGLV
jgi:anaerobic C4-dicarboxylate transporter DcuB